MKERSASMASSTSAHAHLSEASSQRLLDDVGHQPADALGGGSSEAGDRVAREEVFANNPGPHRVVDVVVHVGDDVGDAGDLAFYRARAMSGRRPDRQAALPLRVLAMPSRTSHVRFNPFRSCSSTSTMRRLCS